MALVVHRFDTFLDLLRGMKQLAITWRWQAASLKHRIMQRISHDDRRFFAHAGVNEASAYLLGVVEHHGSEELLGEVGDSQRNQYAHHPGQFVDLCNKRDDV